MEFTCEGLVRYSYGFYNPNHAAAFIVMLLPMFWGVRAAAKKEWIKICVLIPEIVLYAALIFTYSRAGFIVFILSGIMFFILCHINFDKDCFKLSLRFFGSRRAVRFYLLSALFLSVAYFSGALNRYYGWVFSLDRSMTNRLTLWKGGLRMLADNPLGVGAGLSGKIFTEFYQSPENYHCYRTMVNSFLTFLVEQGIMISFIATALILFAVTASFEVLAHEKSEKIKIAVITLLTICFGLLISGMASTCFDLSIVMEALSFPDNLELNHIMQTILFCSAISVLLFFGCISFRFLKLKNLKWFIGLSFTGTFLILISVLIMGKYSSNSENAMKYSVIADSDGCRWIKASSKVNAVKKMLVMPEEKAHGGRELLDFFKTKFKEYEFYIPLTSVINIKNSLFKGYDIAVLTGKNISLAEGLDAEIIFYRPSVFPPTKFTGAVKRIYLDEFDEQGYNSEWERHFGGDKGIIEYLY